MIKARLPVLIAGALLGFAPLIHSAPTPELQKAIRVATFEVVMKKPEKDPLTYEKPLPLDLIPYLQRNDAYESVGTAFALGNNRYVTAAHVIELGIASQWGTPELRRSDGSVFAIDRILKFSMHEDFVVFSLKQDPEPAGLAAERDPKLDDPVLAVGNALGEGIVIREGLLTSLTPEEQDGRWKWLRFSAAASPGNSGGPLCNASGQVIGVVIGKSPNENLNYSLPISRVLDSDGLKARFDLRRLARLPYLHGTTTYAFKDEFSLPLSFADFAAAFRKTVERHDDAARAQLLRTYADTIFPKGPGAVNLLFNVEIGTRPRLILQRDDGTWVAPEPDYEDVALTADGSVSGATVAGARLIRLVRPSKASDDVFYSDSKTFMDFALKALNVRRVVGQDQVRVTSAGRAVQESVFTDPAGRRWQERVWALPYMNSYLVGMLLPTPDGYGALLNLSPSAGLHSTTETLHLMAGLVNVSYTGTLEQWQAALRRRSLLPKTLEDVRLDKSPTWTLRTPRFASSVPAGVLTLTETSPLSLVMGFVSTGPGTEWDIEQVWWEKDDRHDSGLVVSREARPPTDATLELRNKFDSIHTHRPPYDESPQRDSESTYAITTVIDVPGKTAGTVSADLAYGLTVRANGLAGLAEAKASLDDVVAATHIIEHGTGADLPQQEAAAADSISTLQQEALASASAVNSWAGRDVRGRLATDDIQDLINASPKNSAGAPKENHQRLLEQERQKLAWLAAYWNEYPGLTHNRDLWSSFLEKNRWPADMSHQPTVTSAESQLQSALKNPISAEWSDRAQLLKEAYIAERRNLLMHPPAVPRGTAPMDRALDRLPSPGVLYLRRESAEDRHGVAFPG